MRVESSKVLASGIVALFASFVYMTPTEAAFNGAPVGAGSTGTASNNTDPNNKWTSTLIPNPAISPPAAGGLPDGGYCPWVSNGLAQQGFTKANNWTINYQALPSGGYLALSYYSAWVAPWPKVTMSGGYSYGAIGSSTDAGGATIQTKYTPAGMDPGSAGNPVNYGYIQGIYTNAPLGTNKSSANAFNAGGGYYEYLDNNDASYQNNPSYPFNANGTYFADQPGRILAPFPYGVMQYPNGILWEAQVFVDTVTPNAVGGGGTINIYGNGVWWGFKLTETPEPTPLALLMLGLSGMVLRRRKRIAIN